MCPSASAFLPLSIVLNPNLLSQTREATPGGTIWACHAPSPWSVSTAGAPCLLFSSSAPLEEKTIFLSGPKTSSLGLACADPIELSFAPGDGAVCRCRRHPSSLHVSLYLSGKRGRTGPVDQVFLHSCWVFYVTTFGQIRGDSWALRAPERSGSGQIGSENHSPRKYGRKNPRNHLSSCYRRGN